MIQVCDPPRTRQVRRLSAEEFCRLAQSEVSSVYRPRSEVLRMLTVGEVWGVYISGSKKPFTALVIPLICVKVPIPNKPTPTPKKANNFPSHFHFGPIPFSI